MRTVTLLGLMTIGQALRHMACMGESTEYRINFISVIFVCAMIMDLAEFIKKMINDRF